MKEILDVIHKTICQFFDICGDDEEVPMSDKDKLLLEVNKAICDNLKAIEQEPNTWSLDDAREDFMHDVYNELDFLSTNDEANRIIDSFDMVTKGIKQEPRWIPVTERLPEKSYGCLVTVYDTDLRTQDEFENILPYFVGYDGETWNNADGEPIPFEVTAWMPLPQPYKKEDEDGKA